MTRRGYREIISSMRHFVDDDVAYLDWLADHPEGFVLNTGRNPSAAYLMLHRTSCGTIRGDAGPRIHVHRGLFQGLWGP